MSMCRWCTSLGDDVAKLLQRYCAVSWLAEDEEAVNEKAALNDDLDKCLECVVAYHRAKEELPGLHRRLWELETSRLLDLFSHAAKDAQPAKDLSYVEEDGREIGVSNISPAVYEDRLGVPLSEVLKYPYLLASPQLSEMCVEAICKMEEYNSFRVCSKDPGIYLLLVHPNETVRRWAIGAARSLGKVDRDDFYDLQDIFTCMFYIVELRIPQNFPDMDTSYDPTTKMTLLQPHLYDSKNAKNYWLGICMLLTQLDAQAMDSLFLGPDKQANILLCILNALKDEEPSNEMDPFWPVLQCFMVILDCLGSRFWGQIEPSQAFQAITQSPSYSGELESIRQQTMISRVKTETTYDDDMVTCSQMVYDTSTSQGHRRSRGVDSNVVYEDMSSLVNLLHSDVGQALRVHDSTFLWFIPFVKSVMDLDEHSVLYITEVVHYLCGEISTDLPKPQVRICDKVTEFFTLILVHIIELHLGSGRMNMLYYCAPKWVGVLVKCATLPGDAFVHTSEGPVSHSVSSTSSLRVSVPRKASTSRAVPQACMHIIRSLLKEGTRLSPNSKCHHFLNLLNKHLRDGQQREWKLIRPEIQELQICLKDYVKMMMNRPTISTSPPEPLDIEAGPVAPTTPPLHSSNDPSGPSSLAEFNPPIKLEGLWDDVEGSTSGGGDFSGVQRGWDINKPLVKKEPLTPEEEFVEPTNDSRPTQDNLTSLRADPEKIQVIKSRLGQLMTKKSKSERARPSVGLSEFGKEKPENLLTSRREEASNLQGISRHPPCLQESMDNVPLSVLKSNLKGKGGSKSLRDRSKGNSRQFDRPQSPPKSTSDVIVISDDEATLDVGRARRPECLSETSQIKNEPDASDQNPSPWRDYDGDMSESQVFEFETQEDMVSAWSNGDSESNMPPEKPKDDSPVSPTSREPLSSWECDTQPIYDEDIERACQQVEKELEKPKTPPQGLKRAIVVKKRNLLVDAKPLATKCLSKKPTVVEKRIKEPVKDAPHAVTPPLRKSSSTVHSNRLETETRSSLTTSAISHKTSLTPAIVPPKKVRKAPEPVSTAEKLGLKKKVRKAFDLSQGSRDSVGDLRHHGATVNVPQAKKPTRQTKRSKVTFPQKRVVKGSNNKLFQFFRQSKQALGAGISEKAEPMKRNPKKIDEIQTPSFATEEDDEDEDLPSGQVPKSNEGEGEDDDDDDDADWMHLTQMEPTEMEMCTQLEEEEDFFYTQRDPVDMDIDADSQRPFEDKGGSSDLTWFKQRLFLKPGMSPMSVKKAKPSTTKIYATSSSRSASLVQEMERTANVGQSLPLNRLLYKPIAPPPPPKPIPPKQPPPRPEQNLPRPPCLPLRPVQHSNTCSTPQPSTSRHDAPFRSQIPNPEVGFRFDTNFLVQHILKWTFDMFSNYKQFGIPSEVCELPLKEVGSSFSSYDEYYKTFYPLLLTNTFEEVSTSITASDDFRQMFPREEDLVILWLPQNRGAYTWHEQDLLDPQEQFGYVQRSNVCNGGVGQCPTLNLMIKTLGNVRLVNKQAVRCDVVGSLVSTMREFRAICLLNSSSMRKPLLAPHVSYFQPGPEDYNLDQVRAVRTGLSVIRNQQLTPKICLIHGPPGTGKSKTIVGMLQKLFSESMTPPVNRHSEPRRMRVLLCAPSNAAIDNLMKKIIPLKAIQPQMINLKPFSLDSQVKNKTQRAQMSQDSDIHRRRAQLDENIDKISKILPKLQKKEEMSRIRKQETQAQVLQDAHVVCCTLSTSGSTVLESAFRRLGHKPFSCVIVDEAGQATETETLIPLLYHCNALILVGDPHQLPPTVISQKAKELKYGQSLMARLVKNLDRYCKENKKPSPVVFLSCQYRMHPEICEFPSKHIYCKALKTDIETAERRGNFGWPLLPYRVFDVTDGQEVKEGASFSNQKEVQLVVFLLRLMAEKQQVKVGVITPYNAQKDRINREMAKVVNKNLTVDVDTVEGFQGREMDCVIVSCVRASHEQGGIGFLGNRQRLNVTITRAKFSLFILGHLRTLQENQDWGALIKDAATRDVIISTNEMTFKTDARKIFKKELTRSSSYPLREPGPPSAAPCPTADPPRPAPFQLRRSSEPALFAQGRDSPQQPWSASPPQDADRPRDPRLVVQTPQHRPDWNPRAERIRLPQAEIRRDPRAERDPRGCNSPEQRHPTGYQNQRWAVRERDREQHRSPITAPYPGDGVNRPPRDPSQRDYNRYSATAFNHHTHTHPRKRDPDPRWIPPTHSKRGRERTDH
uniref:Senataxin n=1 Tax=Oncorhynchus tshawytscha TaxID=74940 RepID=A0AAZ3RKU9_ONCTS